MLMGLFCYHQMYTLFDIIMNARNVFPAQNLFHESYIINKNCHVITACYQCESCISTCIAH